MIRALALAVCVATLSPFAASAQSARVPFGPAGITDAKPLRHALVIGIDRFEDPRFTSLRFAGDDALALGAALREFDDVRVLTTPEQTTRATILEELAALEHRIRTANDTVVIYVSTHGSLGQEPAGELRRYLAAADTRLELIRQTGLSVDELIHQAESMASKRVALIFASCHSGQGKSQVPDALARLLAQRKSAPMRLEDVSQAVVVLTAAAFGESAREDETLRHDVYTYYLLEALERGDRDGDGAVTIGEAHDYARERTFAFTHGQQRPTSESSVLGADPIVLRGERLHSGTPVVFSYAPSAEGVEVRLDGASKGGLPGGVALTSGAHRLELIDGASGRSLYSGDVTLHDGDRVDLQALLPRPARFSAELQASIFLPYVLPAGGGPFAALPRYAAALTGRLRASNLLVDGLDLELSATSLDGSDYSAGVSSDLPYRLTGLILEAGARWPIALGPLVLGPGVSAGELWLSRNYNAQGYQSSESLRSAVAAPSLDLELPASERLRIGLRAEVPLYSASLNGERALRYSLLIGLHASVSF